jgi:hypothetical protein
MRRAPWRSSNRANLARAASSTGGASRASSSRSTRAAASQARAIRSASASIRRASIALTSGQGAGRFSRENAQAGARGRNSDDGPYALPSRASGAGDGDRHERPHT